MVLLSRQRIVIYFCYIEALAKDRFHIRFGRAGRLDTEFVDQDVQHIRRNKRRQCRAEVDILNA